MENNIRNFAIIAHIDHGKTTLTDRLLEVTNTITSDKLSSQHLDSMSLEKEKGITIKMHPCRMEYVLDNQKYILNLLDTPGHVDFIYEVSRALAAVEGVILLVDATQGVQAQTLANLQLALNHNLKIIGVLNKIDLNPTRTEELKQEIAALINTTEDQIICVSAKTGKNVDILLQRIVSDFPCPEKEEEKDLRALIFDSKYDSYKGVLAYVRVVEGKIKKTDDLYLMAQKTRCKALELGYFKPNLVNSETISSGEIGWIATGLKDPDLVKVGDTVTSYSNIVKEKEIKPLPGYKEPQSMVFAGFFPETNDRFEELQKSLAKLKLTDASFVYDPESNDALGRGFRLGFLGVLHYEIVSLRLKEEFDLDIITTTPMVPYKIEKTNGDVFYLTNPVDYPNKTEIKNIQEPYINFSVLVPKDYLNTIIQIMANHKAMQTNIETLNNDLLIINYELPLYELLTNLYDELKSGTQGFASISYETSGYKDSTAIKLDVLIHGERIESLSFMCPVEDRNRKAREFALRLKETIPPNNFAMAIQIAWNGEVIARETKSAYRKDVTGSLYGGDRTRKDKLLKKQKAGKKRLAKYSKLNLTADVYRKIFINKSQSWKN